MAYQKFKFNFTLIDQIVYKIITNKSTHTLGLIFKNFISGVFTYVIQLDHISYFINSNIRRIFRKITFYNNNNNIYLTCFYIHN